MTRITEEPFGGSPDLIRIAGQLHDAIHHDQRRRTRRRHLQLRLALVAGVAAAVALGAVGVVSSQAPSAVQPASAKVLRRAIEALVPSTGRILHVVMTATETAAGGTTDTWRDETWTDYLGAPGTGQTAFRQVISSPGGPNAETAYVSVPGSTPQPELYDPSTNTIYTGAARMPLPGGGSSSSAPRIDTTGRRVAPPAHAFGCGPGLGAQPIPSTAPQGGAVIIASSPYMGPGSADPFQPLSVAAPPTPWSQVLGTTVSTDLRYGCATLAGHPTIDGRRTLEITGDAGHWTYDADAATGQPIQLDFTGADASHLTLRFDTYQQIPAQGNGDLVNLAAQHPSASVDTGQSDYVAVQARLFATGSRFGTENGTLVKGPPR